MSVDFYLPAIGRDILLVSELRPPPIGPNGWTEERVLRLTQLWASGLMASEIAVLMGREHRRTITRNAILGKLFRLKLLGERSALRRLGLWRPPVTVKAAPPPPKRRPVQHAQHVQDRREAMARIKAALVKEVAPRKPLPICEVVSIMDLTRWSCRYPHGHPQEPTFGYCGKRVAWGRVYCAEHCSIAYVPARSRARA